ncbi:hypothetical protein SEA_MAGRITTE_177 [Microbacterium phage Magritte]|nr:hypothetical protein SEA_MAGRITTE_177 [Microbacterium phage Magritte]
MTYPHILPVPPDWEKLANEEKQAIRHYLQKHFKDAGNPLHRYRAYQAEIRKHNSEIANADTVKRLTQAQPIVGVTAEGRFAYTQPNGTVHLGPPSDVVLAEILTEALDTIEEAIPRLATAIAHKRFPETRPMDIRHAKENAEQALRVFREDVEALTYSDEARAQKRAEAAKARIWKMAADQYYASVPKNSQGMPVPFSMLTEEQREEWFELADDRVPPTWENLTDEQRLSWAGGRNLREDIVRPLYEKERARGLRRRAAKKIDRINPYAVRDPNQRMAEAAEMTRMRSWAREQNAQGRMSDLQLAVWEEHHRRALHAYVRPTEPYVVH